MNIIVSISDGGFCVRPDTTLERENQEYYIPAGVSELTYSPVLFVRMSRAGKCIQPKFAERYYDSGGYGILLYGENLIGQGPAGFSMASSLDRTSVLPLPCYSLDVIRNADNIFTVVSGDTRSDHTAADVSINDVIGRISAMTSLRVGDIVAIELDRRRPVMAGMNIKGELNGEAVFNLDIA